MVKKKTNPIHIWLGFAFIIVCFIAFFIMGYCIGINKNNSEFEKGYMLGCKYKVPDGCKTCTTEEAVNSYCMRTNTDPGKMYMCKLARDNMANGNKIGIYIYDNNSASGVLLN